ncbi:amidohydrolase family protein [Flavobacteriales bacterium]|nr:amidohydrolase family protein [Flavobacteriales bacterium]MDA7794611.1 amidohydrolase family protein [Flavobacteriales bacterium]
MKSTITILSVVFMSITAFAQHTFPINGVANSFDATHAFTNATLVISPQQTIKNGTLIIMDDKIVSASADTTIPKGAIIHDMTGKYIYPSFIDLHSTYGIEKAKKKIWSSRPQYKSTNKSGAGWNEAVHPEVDANELFSVSNSDAESYRAAGFGVVLSHQNNGIARGSGVVTTLADESENMTILKGKASAHYSLNKGNSLQKYPSSLMGTLALIHQTYLDAEWYDQGNTKEYNRSLEAWNELQDVPQFFEVNDKLDIFRIHKIAEEFEIDYIIIGNGDEYQRLDELEKTNFSVVTSLNFPDAYDVSNPQAAQMVSLKKMKHWELAPSNPARLFDQGIFTAFTTKDLEKRTDFIDKVREAIKHGLTVEDALSALTTNPAELLEMSAKIGSLEAGKLANFIVCSDPIFDAGEIQSNWIQGKEYIINSEQFIDLRGTFLSAEKDTFVISGSINKIKGTLQRDTSEYKTKLVQEGPHLSLQYELEDGVYRINSLYSNDTLKGNITMPNGDTQEWQAQRIEAHEEEEEEDANEDSEVYVNDVWFPNMAYGWDKKPSQNNTIFRNATVWTNEAVGTIQETDVAISEGKIIKVGIDIIAEELFKNNEYQEIDAQGLHLTSGIIDEHSHIAISRGVNEGTQASSAEVSIANVINSDDINIYRQLSGGVTTAQLLHGSANPIGGQSGIIKFRWGSSPEEMKFEGADGFIKFALGENVKQSNWGDYERIRFPQTRMGVEQVFYDHFLRARAYEEEWEKYNSLSLSDKRKTLAPREDLEMNTLVEILNSERFITCHSYVQSEINMLMHVADSMGFTLNTFTHILEGYKVADKMKKHGAGASTFSDWWAYKFEVNDAIPYNASILADMGVVTAINSDDAEMARRLNQEAAKAVKYGNVSEEEAWKMVTLNPAKLLHIDDRVGSIKSGKDADIVLWTDNPLSVYAKVQQTYVDGRCYFNVEKDKALRERNKTERARLIQRMLSDKAAGKPTQKVKEEHQLLYHCDTLDEHQGHNH